MTKGCDVPTKQHLCIMLFILSHNFAEYLILNVSETESHFQCINPQANGWPNFIISSKMEKAIRMRNYTSFMMSYNKSFF